MPCGPRAPAALGMRRPPKLAWEITSHGRQGIGGGGRHAARSRQIALAATPHWSVVWELSKLRPRSRASSWAAGVCSLGSGARLPPSPCPVGHPDWTRSCCHVGHDHDKTRMEMKCSSRDDCRLSRACQVPAAFRDQLNVAIATNFRLCSVNVIPGRSVGGGTRLCRAAWLPGRACHVDSEDGQQTRSHRSGFITGRCRAEAP